MPEGWRERIEAHRRSKDEAFADAARSPLAPDARASFDGLDYYPPDPAFRYVLRLDEFDDPETVVVETTADRAREYLAVGEFRFTVGGRDAVLRAYREDREGDDLWLPFRAATSGAETYGGGRYLDLDAGARRREDGRWIVDVNLAYSPVCAHSEGYECPLVPPSNWLDVRIEAGERF